MRGVLVCCLLAGCFNPSPQEGAPCSTSRDCPEGLACNAENKCVRGGGDADIPVDACPDTACMGDLLVGCGTQETCTNGCGGTTPHCLRLAPSNGLGVDMLMGATADVTLDKLSFDASDGSIRMMNVDVREPGTGVKAGIRWEIVSGVSVWTANSFTLAAGGDWSFTGTRPVTLFANTTITVNNPLDLNATFSAGVLGGTSSNTGTAAGCQGRAGRNVDATHADGGGGGGGGGDTRGGNGGPTNTGTSTGLGGQCATRPSTIPLLGGNGGGASGTAPGGGGGGAISLVAMDQITITSRISVSGAGGGLGANGGGGGGGGGAILIEAPTVAITGQLTANGGGGGAPTGGTVGSDGAIATSTPAAGGVFTSNGSTGRGGAGGAGITNATNGTTWTFDDTVNLVNNSRGAGGGGGYGRIEVKRRTGGVSGLASPAANITNAVFE